MPDKYRTTLRFWKAYTPSLTAAQFWWITRVRPSAAFDIDPDLASSSAAGYNELAALYSSYRVLGSRCQASVVNTSDTPSELSLLPLNVDPGASPSSNIALYSKEQPYAKFKMVPTKGGPVTVLDNNISTRRIFGGKMTDFDDNFSALTSTIPNNNWYWMISLYSQFVGTSSQLHVNVIVDIDVEFYDRKFLQGTFL
jgi:hypothetical protein